MELSLPTSQDTEAVMNHATMSDASWLVHQSRPSQSYFGDRFILNRAVINMNIAEALLMAPQIEENPENESPSRAAYRKLLRDTLLQGRSRILCFSNKPPRPTQVLKPQCRCIPQVGQCAWLCLLPELRSERKKKLHRLPKETYRILNIICDKRINLLDWGSNNLIAIALDNVVYLQENCTFKEFSTVTDDYDPVSSVCWAPNGNQIALGFEDNVRVYDTATNKQIRALPEIHPGLIGSLARNNNDILSTGGGRDGTILSHDIRIRKHVVSVQQGHEGAVCGLKWSSSGMHLASGGNDGLLNVWDLRQYTLVLKFINHTASVRAVDWCPFQDDLLASGGGKSDHCIKLWNVSNGKCVNTIDTGSQVSNILWSSSEQELLSSHGSPNNQISVWKYSSMTKIGELRSHTSPVLYMAQSPDGCKVASASADRRMMIWSISANSATKKNKIKCSHTFGPSNMYSHIR